MRVFAVTGKRSWKVLGGTKRSQAAEMVVAPGDSEGGPDNRHPKSDQWLFVIGGRGHATVEGRQIPLGPGSLLLIEKGERHQITASGRTPLKTLNFYGPRAYS
jgi:mannose-6-phosphate isomerase-like protein (cupin superfamily)